MLLRSFLPSLCLFTAAVAQSVAVFPSDHTNIQNGGYSSGMFPYSFGISRMQSVYDAWDLQVPAGHQITAIGVRQEGSSTSTGCGLQLEVRLGETTFDSGTIPSGMDANFTSPPVTVFGPAPFTLPDLTPATTAMPIWVHLTTPYTYQGGNLLVEWRIHSNTLGNASWFYYLDAATHVMPVHDGPTGCPNANNQQSQLSTTDAAPLGGTWRLDIWHGPPNTFGLLMVAFGRPLVAPYSLQSLLTGISPACLGQIDLSSPLLTTGLVTDVGGGSPFFIPLPADRLAWHQASLSMQAIMLDPAAPGSAVVTNGEEVQFGVRPANTMLVGPGSASATSGLVYRNYGLVTLFQHQ